MHEPASSIDIRVADHGPTTTTAIAGRTALAQSQVSSTVTALPGGVRPDHGT